MAKEAEAGERTGANIRAPLRARVLGALAGAALLLGCSSDVQNTSSSGSGGGASSSSAASSSSSSGGGASSSSAASSSSSGGVPCMTPSDCPPGPATGCSLPVCNAGQCAVAFAPSGMDSAQQTPADCKHAVCDGLGGVTDIPNDLDIPKGGQCVIPSCKNGVPVLTPAGVATSCNGTCHCDGIGACAGPGCITDAICPQDPAGCFPGKCVGCEECMFVPAPAGKPTALSPKGDCKFVVCDGNGGTMTIIDNSDIPNDNDPCTVDTCVNGAPMHAPLCPPLQTCIQGVCSP